MAKIKAATIAEYIKAAPKEAQEKITRDTRHPARSSAQCNRGDKMGIAGI